MVQENLNDHDKIILAMTKIFSVYGFDVSFDVKGSRYHLDGNSGSTYRPDLVPKRGMMSIVCDIRTRGQRGMSPEIDRGAIQLLQAELDDLRKKLKRPMGMIVNPHGIKDKAMKLASHFGIQVVTFPMDIVDKINAMTLISDKHQIIFEARKLGIEF